MDPGDFEEGGGVRRFSLLVCDAGQLARRAGLARGASSVQTFDGGSWGTLAPVHGERQGGHREHRGPTSGVGGSRGDAGECGDARAQPACLRLRGAEGDRSQGQGRASGGLLPGRRGETPEARGVSEFNQCHAQPALALR
jgi:hypothetical protein